MLEVGHGARVHQSRAAVAVFLLFPLSAIRYRRIRYRRRELCVMFRRVFCVFRIFYIFLYWRVTMFAPLLPEQVITSVNNMENIDVLDLRRLL